MHHNCEKIVVSGLWKERVMATVSVLQRIKFRCYFQRSAGKIIFSLFKVSHIRCYKMDFGSSSSVSYHQK